MSDSEYSSDDDEDYVPEVESGSDGSEYGGQDEKIESQTKSAKKNKPPQRKRKGGIKLEEYEDDVDNRSDEDDKIDEQEKIAKEQKKKEKDEESRKAHMEDLWASFKSDTAYATPKQTTPSSSTVTKDSKDTKQDTILTKHATSKVTITKTFDFAGEAVIITKTVDAASHEARKAQKQKEEASNMPTTSAPLAINPPGGKRKGGLGNVLGQLGKKNKISTLEKSKLDWEDFKAETGIAEDLKNFNKNGYLERQDFLQRTDERLFEREKQTRAAVRKQWNT